MCSNQKKTKKRLRLESKQEGSSREKSSADESDFWGDPVKCVHELVGGKEYSDPSRALSEALKAMSGRKFLPSRVEPWYMPPLS